MSSQDLSETIAIVTGASKGFGRGVAAALSHAGAQVIGVARDTARLEQVHAELGETFTPVAADASDPVVAGQLIDTYQPRTLVLNAGARPLTRPVHQHTWETFSRNWHVDVQQVFNWTREALIHPLAPGSTVVAFSSGAAVAGSPLSGGYAGAKATQRFIAAYAQDEAQRAGLDLTFTAVLPRITSHAGVGRPAVRAYAARGGKSEEEYLEQFGPPLTPAIAGAAMVELVRKDAAALATSYMLTGGGLQDLA